MPSRAAQAPLASSLLSQIRFAHALNSMAAMHPQAQRRFRSLHISGFFLAISGLLSVAGASWLGAGDVADVIALRILSYGCWLYGGMGLWILLEEGAFQGSQLAGLRGLRLNASLPFFAATSTRLFSGICLSSFPGLLLALFLAPSAEVTQARFVQLLATFAYVIILAFALSVVASLCRLWSPSHARFLALLIIVLPFFVHLAMPSFPNLLSPFIAGMGQLIEVGAP